MTLSADQIKRLLQAARGLDFSAPCEPIADFATRVLSLDAATQMALFGDPKSQELLRVANCLSGEVDRLLNYEGEIPAFGVLITQAQPDAVAGFGTILSSFGAAPKLVARLKDHSSIRKVLCAIVQGHDLEAIAAAVLDAACGKAEATRGSGDQGIDVIGSQVLLSTEPLFASLTERGKRWALPSWEKAYFIASSKANVGRKGKQDLVNPAFIRELVGGWVIQRTSVGHWSQAGISPLSAVQLIFVTTYRLSAPGRAECRKLGVQIWSLSELICLIAKFGPNNLFGADGKSSFDVAAFTSWWSIKDNARVSEKNVEELLAIV